MPGSGVRVGRVWVRAIAGAALIAMAAALIRIAPARAEGVEHLVINELATGGVGASDEFIELLNPAPVPLSLAGLEVLYVSGSGATVSQRAAWPAGAPLVPPGGHVLLANDAGSHAATADVLYRGGLADSGGTVVLRVLGSATAIDAVAWGAANGAWLEGTPAPAPRPGSSLQRVASPSDGRVQDSGDNAADFIELAFPTPQGSTSPLPTAASGPSPTPGTSPSSMVLPSPTPTVPPSPQAMPMAIPIAAARNAPNGTTVTIDGTALTDSAFHDGGGYVADSSGGIAVIVDDGSFQIGPRIVVTGSVDDRFAQRTIRAHAADILVLGEGASVQAVDVSTGSIGEALEGSLVRITATVRSGPTPLSAGNAYEVDDGSGEARVIVGSATGIDAATWAPGVTVAMIGVVGQRDSSGTGASGYRIQPRSPSDLLGVTPAASPAASPAPSPTAAPTVSAAPPPAGITSIRDARAAATGTHLSVRGVVTMAPGIVDAGTAVVQDATAAIVLRVDEETTAYAEGTTVEVDGIRSTRSGMETLRVSSAPRVIAVGGESVPSFVAAGDVGEGIEAQLVTVRGQLVQSARRASSGTVTFDITDGSGTVRVVLPASLESDDSGWSAGTSVEAIGVVGQQTTAAAPTEGYRIWPRSATEVRVLEAPVEEGAQSGSTSARRSAGANPRTTASSSGPHDVTRSLVAVGGVDLADLRIGATLVVAAWPELELSGLLWDGERLVAISAASTETLSVLGPRPQPVAVQLSGLRAVGVEPTSGVPMVELAADGLTLAPGTPSAPLGEIPAPGEPAAWVTAVGRVVQGSGGALLEIGRTRITLDIRCGQRPALTDGAFSVTGIGLGRDEPQLIVPCDGIRAAPTLARAIRPDSDGGAGAVLEPVTDPSEASLSVADGRRTIAASLLALGVLAVGGAAFVWRRLVGRRDPVIEDGPDVAGAASGVPPLPLIRLRRDGGS